MEALIGLTALGVVGVGIYHLIQQALRGSVRRVPPPDPALVAQQRATAAQALAQRRERDAQSHRFQTALLQIANTPDFRRAATLAAAAKLVPADFRRRQCTRFRPMLIAHYRRCMMQPGCDEEVLMQSLRALAVALGVAAFEADYVKAAADRMTRRGKPSPTPANRLAELKRDHESRAAAIRTGLAQNPDLQEQLLEAEENRFRQALESAFETAPPEANNSGI